MALCRVRVEDHGLLADLHLAVVEISCTFINVQDGAGDGLLGIDKPEAARDRACAEQALAGAEYHRKLPEAQRIDEIMLEQGLQKLAATVDLNLAAVLDLELRHLLGKLALEQDGIVPVEPTQKVGAGTTANPAPAGQSRADPHVFDALQLAKVQWQETLDSIAPLAA